MHYLLFYEVSDDYVARRAEFRDGHLRKAWEAAHRGELVLGGALADPVDGAVLLFKGDSPEVAERFARSDPYVTGGAVKRWHVREWTTVVGFGASMPVVPETLTATSKAGHQASFEAEGTTDRGPILRMWKGRSTIDQADKYVRHATTKVFPALRAIDGHRGTYLLRRAAGGAVEFVVLTLWQSMDAVRRFAGSRPEKAVVEPEAQAILSGFDEAVVHFEIVEGPPEKS
jgi:uncharacterized protein